MNIKVWEYSGGEIGVRLNDDTVPSVFRIQNSKDAMTFFMAMSAFDYSNTDIVIPYLPYARQDRKATEGDPVATDCFILKHTLTLLERMVLLLRASILSHI